MGNEPALAAAPELSLVKLRLIGNVSLLTTSKFDFKPTEIVKRILENVLETAKRISGFCASISLLVG